MRVTRNQLRQIINEELSRLNEQKSAAATFAGVEDDDMPRAEIKVPVDYSHNIFIFLQGLESDARRIRELLRGESPDDLSRQGGGSGFNIALRRELDRL